MVKFPLVLLLFEVLVGWPEGGGCHQAKDVPYAGIHADWHSSGNGGNDYNRNVADNQRHPNDDRHHIVQPSNCTSNYMDVYNQYMCPRRFQEFPPFSGPPPYSVPPPFPAYPPHSSNVLFPNQQQPPHFSMYQNKQPLEPKEERPPQRQPVRNPPPHEDKRPSINHAQSPYNMNFMEPAPGVNFRGPPNPDGAFPPPMYPGPLGAPLPIPPRPPMPPIGNTQLPYRNEPLQPKEGYDMLPVPPVGMMERPGLIDMFEPVPPRFMPKRHIPYDFDNYGPHPLYKRDDISEGVSSTSHAEKKTNPPFNSNQALTVSPSSEKKSESSDNRDGNNSKQASKHSLKSDQTNYNDITIPSKGVQFVTSAPYNQFPSYQNPTLPVSVQNDPMEKFVMQPTHEFEQTAPNNKQLILFQELLRKLQGGFANSLFSNGQTPNAPDFSPSNVTPQKNQEIAVQIKPTNESSSEVTKERESVQKSNRPERENQIHFLNPIVPNGPLVPPPKQSDYERSFVPPFNKMTEQITVPNFDIDPRKYFGGPNYADPRLNETPNKYPFVRPYGPQSRNFPNPNTIESTIVDPYYAPRPIVVGPPEVPYEPITKSLLPIDPVRKYPDSGDGYFTNEPNNGSSRALRKARDTSLIDDTSHEDEQQDRTASGVFRRYLSKIRSKPAEENTTNISFKFKPSQTQFLPTPLPPSEQSEAGNENAAKSFGWEQPYHALQDRKTQFLTTTLRPEVISLLSDNKYIKRKYMRPEQLVTEIPHIHSPYQLGGLWMAHQPSAKENMIQEEFQNIVPLASRPSVTIRAFRYFPGSNKKPRQIWNNKNENWDADRIYQRMQYPPMSHTDEIQEETRKYFSEEYNPNQKVWPKRRKIYEHLLSKLLGKMGLTARPVYSTRRVERFDSNPSPYSTFPENHGTSNHEELPDIKFYVHPENENSQRGHSFESLPAIVNNPNEKSISKLLSQMEKIGKKIPYTVKVRLYRINPERSPDKESHEEELNFREEYPHYLRGKVHLLMRPIENEVGPQSCENHLKLFRVPLSNDYEPKVCKNLNLDKLIADILKNFGISGKPLVIRKIRLHKFSSVPSPNIIETTTNDEERIPFERPSKDEDPLSADVQLFVPRKPRHTFEYPMEPLLETSGRDHNRFEMISEPRSEDLPSVRLRIIRLLKEPEKDGGKVFLGFHNKLAADEPVIGKTGNYMFDSGRFAKTVNDAERFQNSLLPGIINPRFIDSGRSPSFYRSVRYESGPGNAVTKIVETISPDGQHEKSVYEIPRSKLRDDPNYFPSPSTGYQRSSEISPFLTSLLKMFGTAGHRLQTAQYKNEGENSIASGIETKSEDVNAIESRDSLDQKPEIDEKPYESNSPFMGGILDDIMKNFHSPKESYFARTVRLEKGPGNSFTKIIETTNKDGQKTVRAETVYDSAKNQSSRTPDRPQSESQETQDDSAMDVLRNMGLNVWPFNGGVFGENGVRPEIHRYKFIITPDLKAKLISVKPHVFQSRKGDSPEPTAEEAETSPMDAESIPSDSLPIPPMTTTPMPESLPEDEDSENPAVQNIKSPPSDEPTLQAVAGLATPPETQVKSDNSTSSLRFYWKILDALSSAICPPYLIRPKSFVAETFNKIRKSD